MLSVGVEEKKKVTDKEGMLSHFTAWKTEEQIKHSHSLKHKVKILRAG